MLHLIRQRKFSLILLLIMLLLCMSYLPSIDVVLAQIIAYLVVLILCIALPKYSRMGEPQVNVTLIAIMVVAIAFGIRITYDLEVKNVIQYVYTNHGSFYFFYLFTILSPLLLLTHVRLRSKEYMHHAYLTILAIFIVALSISCYNIFNGRGIMTNDLRFLGNEKLGSIQFGHLGVTTILLSFSLLVSRSSYSIMVKIIYVWGLVIGFISILLAGTRGAFVALAICLLFYAFSMKRMSNYIALLLASIIFIYSQANLTVISDLSGGGSVERIFRLFNESGDQSSGRSELYQIAIKDILDYPIFGKSYFFNPNSDNSFYIHNSILEMGRSIGMIGGALFVYANYQLLKMCKHIIAGRTEYTFIALLFVQYLVFSLFSETIIRLTPYWFSMAMVMCIYNNLQNLQSNETRISNHTHV